MRKIAGLPILFVSMGMLGACASAGKHEGAKTSVRKEDREPATEYKRVPFEHGQVVQVRRLSFTYGSAIDLKIEDETKGIIKTAQFLEHIESQGWSSKKKKELGRMISAGGALDLSGSVQLTKTPNGNSFGLDVPAYNDLKFPVRVEIGEITYPECELDPAELSAPPPHFTGWRKNAGGYLIVYFQSSSACKAVLEAARKQGLPLTLVIPDATGEKEIYVEGSGGSAEGSESSVTRGPTPKDREVPFKNQQTVNAGDLFFNVGNRIMFFNGVEHDGIINRNVYLVHSESGGWVRKRQMQIARRIGVGGALDLSGVVLLTQNEVGASFWLDVLNYEKTQFPVRATIRAITHPDCEWDSTTPPNFIAELSDRIGSLRAYFKTEKACKAVLDAAEKVGLPLTLVFPDPEGEKEIYAEKLASH